jgi:hypothetical protein
VTQQPSNILARLPDRFNNLVEDFGCQLRERDDGVRQGNGRGQKSGEQQRRDTASRAGIYILLKNVCVTGFHNRLAVSPDDYCDFDGI